MFCTTECWNCEDKSCEHYKSKHELYFENQRLKEVINEITKLVNNYEECEKIIGAGKPMFPLYKLQNIIHKVKENK